MANSIRISRHEYNPRTVSHPGSTLGEKIQEMQMSIKEFAIRACKPEKTIIAVLKGDSSITPDMAVTFENITRIPAHFWMARQRIYDEFLARKRMEAKTEEYSKWMRHFPVSEMMRYGWLPMVSGVEAKVKALLQFFAISSPEAWDNYYLNQQLKVAFRISLRTTQEPYAVSAWLRQGDIQAETESVSAPFSEKSLRESIQTMKALMAEAPSDWASQLKTLCSGCGVKLVYTQSLPKAPINGAARWVAGKYPLIQMSGRHKRYDIFWFSFFHEVGHILLHGKKDFFLENVEYGNKENAKEAEADIFASNVLLPKEQIREIAGANDFTPTAIKGYAKKFGTHQSVIVGRLQHLKIIPYNYNCQLLDKINLWRQEPIAEPTR